MRNLLIITAILLLAGCSSKLAYKNLDWLSYWYIDDYIQLTEEQEVIFDQKLTIWLKWHKQEELPRYLTNLNELTADISNQRLSIERLTYYQEAIKQHWQRIITKVAPDLVQMAPLLNSQQVAYLFRKMDKKNTKERKEIDKILSLSTTKQQKKGIKKYKKNLKRWFGKLTSEQETLAADMYSQTQSNDLLWLEYKKRYQIELKNLFEKSDRSVQFSEELFQLIIEPSVFRSDELNQINAENSAIFKYFLLKINSVATAKQGLKLIKEINKFAKNAEALM